MPGAVSCDMLLYADDTCLVFQDKDLSTIKEKLNSNFNNLCDWFVDNKLSIHFGEDKTKLILFSGRGRPTDDNLNITHNGIKVSQHKEIKYLGCIFYEKATGEKMAIQVIKKINGRLKFLWRKQKFLSPHLRRLLCNALIQPHFDYAASAWYPNLQKKFKSKLQICQNKCIRFCLSLGSRSHIGAHEFETINWLPVSERFQQCVITHVFKQKNKLAPKFMDEMFVSADQYQTKTRASINKLFQPQCNKVIGYRAISSLGPTLWNKLPNQLKSVNSVNTFKHKIK